MRHTCGGRHGDMGTTLMTATAWEALGLSDAAARKVLVSNARAWRTHRLHAVLRHSAKRKSSLLTSEFCVVFFICY
jgi:hypothetical protein